MLYVQRVSRLSSFARRYLFDLLVVVGAIASVFELVLRQSSLRAPTTTLWFAVPATLLLVLALLGRRRFPFAAPASVWLLAAALSFVDGR